MMKEEQKDDTRKLIKKIERIHSIIITGDFGGSYDKTLKYIEQAEELMKHFQGNLPEEIKNLHLLWLHIKANISAFSGDLIRNFKDTNELITVAQLYNNKLGISNGIYTLGRYYALSGDLDEAFMHFDRAIRLIEKNLNTYLDFGYLANYLFVAILFSDNKEDLERTKKYFKRLEEISELYPKRFDINDKYQMAKASLLKSSTRFRDRVMAEDIFREIIENERPAFMYNLTALTGLCELFLFELRVSNDINIISEIKPLIEKMIDMAQHSGLYYWLIEANILRGKLALITFDMESSQLYLMEAQRIAENYGYIGLANEIARLHEDMLEKKDTWEQMEKRNAPIPERMELARLDDHLKGKFRRLIMKMERVADSPPKKDVF